ncbi:hypothetical protein ACQP1G_29950 [Nocardia sp. CA-107356]|uniref:hypothetical protein n=1 Tax=Nocardia sp. CA-107356 TaxID=3239972 RepID=UPI003D8A4ABA
MAMNSGAVLFGMVAGGGVQWGAQEIQIAQGHRDSVDFGVVGVATAVGAVSGLVGAEVGRLVAPAVTAMAAPVASTVATHVMATVAAGTLGGVAGAGAGAVTAWSLTGEPMHLADMLLTGFGAGFVGAAGSALRAGRSAAQVGVSPGGPVHRVAPQIEPGHAQNFPHVGNDLPTARKPMPAAGDGHAAQPEIGPELLKMGAELDRKLAGTLRAEDFEAGPARDAVKEFLDSQRVRAERGDSDGTGRHPNAGDERPGLSHKPQSGGTPPTQGGNPDRPLVEAGQSASSRTAVAPRPHEDANVSAGATHMSRPGELVHEGAAVTHGPAGQRGGATPELAPGDLDGAGAASGGGVPGHETGTGHQPPHSTEMVDVHGDSTHHGGGSGTGAGSGAGEPQSASSAGDGGAQYVAAPQMGAGLRNCVQEVVSYIQSMVGDGHIDASLLSGRQIGLQGVGHELLARMLRADWRPGGFGTLDAVIEHVQHNGGFVATGVQLKNGLGAHAFVVSKNSLGHVEVRERVGNQVREIAGDVVTEWKVDAQGRRVGPVRVRLEDNALHNWKQDLLPHIEKRPNGTDEKVFGAVFTDEGAELPLAPGQMPKGQAGHDAPEDPMGFSPVGGDTLEKGSPRQGIRIDEPVSETAFKAAFERDLAQLLGNPSTDHPNPARPSSDSLPSTTGAIPNERSLRGGAVSTAPAAEPVSPTGQGDTPITAPDAAFPGGNDVASQGGPEDTVAGPDVETNGFAAQANPVGSVLEGTPGADHVAAQGSTLKPDYLTPDTNGAGAQAVSSRPVGEAASEPDANGSNAHARSPKSATDNAAQGHSLHTAPLGASHGIAAQTADISPDVTTKPLGAQRTQRDDADPDVPPAEFELPPGEIISTSRPGMVPYDPHEKPVVEFPNKQPDEHRDWWAQRDYTAYPGQQLPEPQRPRETVLPRTSDTLPRLPATPPRFTLDPIERDEQDPNKTSRPTPPPEAAPTPPLTAEPPLQLPISSDEQPQSPLPEQFSGPLDRAAPGAPIAPSPPGLNPDDLGRDNSLDYIPGIGVPSSHRATPPERKTMLKRPALRAQAAFGNDFTPPGKRRNKPLPPDPQAANPIVPEKTVQQAKEYPAAAAPGSPDPGVPGAPGHGALSPEQSPQGPGAAPQPDPYEWEPRRDWDATEHVTVLGVVHAFEQLNPATRVSFRPGVDLRRAQAALQTIHDRLTDYPMVVIRELAITGFEDGRIYDGFPHVSDGQVVTGRLQLDVDCAVREKGKEDRSLTIEEVCQYATEIFADALIFATCWRAEAQAETALRKTHERRAATESPVDFDKWLQTQFTKACFFNKKPLRDLDIRQAFRQSFAAKEYWFNPSPGEYALYSLLTTLARQLHGMTLPPERVLTAAELASMEEGAEIARGLEHDLGVKAVGLAGPDLDLDALRQFAQAMRELLTKNPGLLAPDPEHHRPVIGVDMPSRYTSMIWTRSQEIDGRRQVTGFWLSERYAMSLSLFQQAVQRSVDSQWLSADSKQAFKSLAFHEEGHLFHNLSGLKYIPEADYQNIMSALVALFVRTSLSTTMDTFPAWLRRELSGYSFQRRETKHKASETPKEQEGADAVALRELYAEANMAVNMHGSRATDAQKLVHSHLMAAYERQKQSEHDAGGVRSEGGEDGLTAAPHKPSERSVTPWSGAGSVTAENRPADRHSATDGDVRATQQAGRDAGGTALAPTDGQSKPGRAGDTPVASPAAPRGRGAMPFDPVQMAGDNGRDVEIDHAVARRRNGRNDGAWAVFNRFAGENAGQHDGRKRPDKGAAAEAAPTPWSRRSADTAAVPARPQTVQVLSQTPDDLEMQIRWQRALRDDAATERGLDPAMLTPNSLALEWLRIRAEAARDELAESLGVDRGELHPRLVRHALDELQAGLNYLHDEGWLRVSRERPATEVMAWIGRFVRQIAAEQEATTRQQKNHLKLIRDELHSNLHEILGTRWELGRASIFAIDWKFDVGKVNDKRELLLGQSWRPFENNPMGNLRRYGHVAGIPEILHLADAVECFEAATLVQHADEFNRLSAMAEAGTGMSRTVARFDSSTRQEFVAPVPMRDEFLRNFPRIPVEQAFSSIADIGRSFSLDPYGLRLTAQAYDVASEFIAPFHKWVGESMLRRLRPRAAENPLWRCMFAARDGHIIAAAIRNIDPVFFAKFCREVGYSSKVIEMVARDFERLTGKKLPLPKTFRSGLSEEAEALVPGTYRNFVKHMRSEGIDLELPGSAYTIVDDALRGRMEEVVKHVFTEPEITGEYTILTIHPDDPHPNSKRGHLFHLPASHWQGGSGLTRYVPAEERLTFLANPAVWIFEELGQGPAHTVENITENGPDQRRAPKTRFSRDRFPPDLDEMAREPRVVQAMKTAVLLATAHYARDGGQGDVRPFLRQSRSWVLQDGNTDPRFFALASALVPRFQGVQEGWLVPDARPTRPKLPTGGNAGETFAPTRTRKAAP